MKIKSDYSLLFTIVSSLSKYNERIVFSDSGDKYEYYIPNGIRAFNFVYVSRRHLLKYLKRKKIKFSVVEMIETIEEVMDYYDFLDMTDIVAAIDRMKECIDNPEAVYNYCKMYYNNRVKSLYPSMNLIMNMKFGSGLHIKIEDKNTSI